jgi:hypothetical protein
MEEIRRQRFAASSYDCYFYNERKKNERNNIDKRINLYYLSKFQKKKKKNETKSCCIPCLMFGLPMLQLTMIVDRWIR